MPFCAAKALQLIGLGINGKNLTVLGFVGFEAANKIFKHFRILHLSLSPGQVRVNADQIANPLVRSLSECVSGEKEASASNSEGGAFNLSHPRSPAIEPIRLSGH